MKTFNEFLKENLKGHSLRQVEILTGVSNSHLSMILNGKRPTPKPDILEKLSKVTKCSYEELLIAAGYLKKRDALLAPVLGSIPAGVPLEAIQEVLDTEELDPEKFPAGTYYGLKVKGDSMSPKLEDGDIVIFKVQEDCESGDICAVMVNGYEATLKRVKKDTNGISLIPYNTNYMPQFFTNELIEQLPVRIIGKAVEIRRSL